MKPQPLLLLFIVMSCSRYDNNPMAISNAQQTSDRDNEKDSCTDDGDDSHLHPSSSSSSCSIYLAPTSLIGVKGFGVYTTRSFSLLETILPADGPNIPVIDTYYDAYDKDKHWTDLFNNYWWGRGVSDDVLFEADYVMDFQITFGALPNHHSVLGSLQMSLPEVIFDDTLAPREESPGAGAFAGHAGRGFVANRDVVAGEELFLDYGFPQESWGKYVPNAEDYETGANILYLVEDIVNDLQHLENDTDKMDDIISNIKEKTRKRFGPKVSSTLPGTYSKFQQVTTTTTKKKNGNTIPQHITSFQLAKQLSVRHRTVDWITSNGICIHNLIPQPSTIPHAGRGAFAQWDIAAGDIIVPAPLMQIVDDDLTTYESYFHDGEGEEGGYITMDRSRKVGRQLLLNYCFGHEESSLLLCPNTNAILINHCSARTAGDGGSWCGDEMPNAEYRWATGWDGSTKEWLDMSLEEMAQYPEKRGLSFEIVATRDIKAGEEVFIDYGISWETAWNNHVKHWKPPNTNEESFSYSSTRELNEKKGLIEPVSNDLRRINRFPSDNIITGCVYWETDQYTADDYPQFHTLWKNLSDEEILRYYSDDGSHFILRPLEDGVDGTFWPCSIVYPEIDEDYQYNGNNDGDDVTYTVRIFSSLFHQRDNVKPLWQERGVPRFLTNYPRRSIRFFNKPYKSDQHLRGAFRHPIGIRDEIFPDKWKNRRRGGGGGDR